MPDLSSNERLALRDTLREGSVSRQALGKFCEQRAEKNRRDAQSSMLSVPRQWEQAADYMARAAEMESLIALMEQAIDSD